MAIPTMTAENSLIFTGQYHTVYSIKRTDSKIIIQFNRVGDYVFSQSNHYAVKDSFSQARTLYVRKGRAGPQPKDFFKKEGGAVVINTNTGKLANSYELKKYRRRYC